MQNNTTTNYASWTASKWLRRLATVLLALILIYLIHHLGWQNGREYFKLNAKQVQRVSSLVLDTNARKQPVTVKSASDIKDKEPVKQDNGKKQNVPEKPDTGKKETAPEKPDSTKNNKKLEKPASCTKDSASVDLIISFLNIELGDLDTTQRKDIENYIWQSRHDPREIAAFLTDTRYKVKSFFNLAGPLVYLEVIFWSLFGVLASLLYYVSNAERKKDEVFDPTEIPYQVAKLFYAPLSTLVLVLGYNMMTGQNLVDIDAGKGMIVFAFLAGFYSGRTMNFLDRLKEFLLPGHEPESKNEEKEAAAETKVAEVKGNITLDATGLTDEQKNDIIEAGWNNASMTLTPKAGGSEIVLNDPTEDQGNTFTGKNIPYGMYTVKTVFSFEDKQGVILNFKAEQEVDVNQPQFALEVTVKKSTDHG